MLGSTRVTVLSAAFGDPRCLVRDRDILWCQPIVIVRAARFGISSPSATSNRETVPFPALVTQTIGLPANTASGSGTGGDRVEQRSPPLVDNGELAAAPVRNED